MKQKFGVDSGTIAIVTAEFLEAFGGKPSSNGAFKKMKGEFKARLAVAGYGQTWGTIGTDKGVYVGDPCYCFGSKQWAKVLKETDYFREDSKDFVSINTDDGEHSVTASFDRIEEAE